MKRAFTLIELLVYMMIMGFIIVVAGRVFSDSTRMRVRSQDMIASAEQIGKLSVLINEDVSQMGTKVWGKKEGENYNVSVERNVYMAPDDAINPDFSSYRLTHRTNVKDSLDNLVFRKVSFDNEGKSLGVREISWYMFNDSIYRSCRTIAPGTDNEGGSCPIGTDPKKVLMGTSIEKFYLIPSAPGISASSSASSATVPDTLFGANINLGFSLKSRPDGNGVKAISGGSGDLVTLSGFAGNGTNENTFNQVYLGEKDAEDWKKCSQFPLKKGETYAVEFKMPLFVGQNNKPDTLSSQFLAGKDHIAVGLRDINGSVPAGGPIDVLLYPPQSEKLSERVNTMLRRAEFSPEIDIPAACVALTFAFYSPSARSGRLNFSEFRVFRVNTKAFYFPKEIANYGAEDFADAKKRIWQKENAKAFQLILETNKGKKGERTRTSFAEGNGMVILTPNNGVITQGSAP